MNVARHVRHLGSVIGGVILLGSLLGASAVSAATYYVATTGNDANSGTSSAPFRTLAKGVKGLKPGDTLYIKSGTYAEALNNNIPGGTSWSSPVTVAAYPGQTVTLRPTGGPSVLRFAQGARKYIVINGLILDGINVYGSTVTITYSSSMGASHHIRIKNSEIKNAQITRQNPDPTKHYGDGIGVATGSDYNEFINLKVHDNGATDFDHGVYISSSHNLVENSQFYRNAGYGVHLYAGGKSGVVNNNIVRNNKIYDNARVGKRGWGIIVSSGSGNLVHNNLIWGNKQGGIQVTFNSVSNTKIYNNTVYANGGTGIYIGSASNTKVQNNIVYGNSGPAIDNKGSGTLLSNNLLNVDPKLVNAAAHDFRLQAGSPAINTGVTLSEVPKDYGGVSRPQGGTYDIGGYEYTGSTSSALVTAPMNLRIVDSQ